MKYTVTTRTHGQLISTTNMQGGDISNEEAPRLWYVWEGLFGEPKDGLVPQNPIIERYQFGGRRGGKLQALRYRTHSTFKFNYHMAKVVIDQVWRQDVRVMVVSFLFGDDDEWAKLLQRELDDFDCPAQVRAYTLERFLSQVVVAPSCHAVYCHPSFGAMRFGGRGVGFEPGGGTI